MSILRGIGRGIERLPQATGSKIMDLVRAPVGIGLPGPAYPKVQDLWLRNCDPNFVAQQISGSRFPNVQRLYINGPVVHIPPHWLNRSSAWPKIKLFLNRDYVYMQRQEALQKHWSQVRILPQEEFAQRLREFEIAAHRIDAYL